MTDPERPPGAIPPNGCPSRVISGLASEEARAGEICEDFDRQAVAVRYRRCRRADAWRCQRVQQQYVEHPGGVGFFRVGVGFGFSQQRRHPEFPEGRDALHQRQRLRAAGELEPA